MVSGQTAAADSINGGSGSTALSTGQNANSWDNYSTAIGNLSVAGGNKSTQNAVDFKDSITVPAYQACTNVLCTNGTAGYVVNGNSLIIKDDQGEIVSTITDFNGTSKNNVAIGYKANALWGNDTDLSGTLKKGGSSTAVGVESLAMIGGTAVGNEAWSIGRDSVAIGKETKAYGYKSVAIGEDAVVRGGYATAVGNGSSADGDYASAFGVESQAAGERSVALGANAEATGQNSVALGADSLASRNNTVSVGRAGAERTISNVADGIYATDAVNLRQLENVERKLSSGIAAAMAFTVPTIAQGKSTGLAIGAANYNGASAMSLNLAHKFTDEIIGTAGVAKGFNSASTSRGNNDDIGIKASVSWSF